MQELIYWVIGGLLVLAAAIAILRLPPRAFGLPKDALWTPESEADQWRDCAGLQAESKEAQKLSMLREYSGAQNFAPSPEQYAQMQNVCNSMRAPTHTGIDFATGPDYSVETRIDRYGNVVSLELVHGDALPEEE